MQQIISADIIDLVPNDSGFIYTEKSDIDGGNVRVSFYSYDCETSICSPITKRSYTEMKFGPYGSQIASALGNNGEFVLCDSTRFYNNLTVTLNCEGSFSIFSPRGELLQQSELLYQDSPVCSPIAYGKMLWCVVPDRNALILYSLEEGRMMRRLGGGSGQTFISHPVSITQQLDKIYICNRDSMKISTVKLDNLDVIDKSYRSFDEPVYKYFRVYDREFVLLRSGVYEI